MAVDTTRWGVIYNPKAGSKKAQQRWADIRGYMESREVQFDYVQSEGFGSVERLARTMANNGYRTIVVVGGFVWFVVWLRKYRIECDKNQQKK